MLLLPRGAFLLKKALRLNLGTLNTKKTKYAVELLSMTTLGGKEVVYLITRKLKPHCQNFALLTKQHWWQRLVCCKEKRLG